MKHKHYEMIVAKAANMDLVVFCDGPYGKKWHVVDHFWPQFGDEFDYFLCLPQHKEACLHWLNGGEVQVRDFVTSPFCDVTDWSKEWLADGCGFMVDSWVFRIKPKKAKRWIGVYNHNVTSQHFDSIETAKSFIRKRDEFKNCTPEAWKFIEIEVEV